MDSIFYHFLEFSQIYRIYFRFQKQIVSAPIPILKPNCSFVISYQNLVSVSEKYKNILYFKNRSLCTVVALSANTYYHQFIATISVVGLPSEFSSIKEKFDSIWYLKVSIGGDFEPKCTFLHFYQSHSSKWLWSNFDVDVHQRIMPLINLHEKKVDLRQFWKY